MWGLGANSLISEFSRLPQCYGFVAISMLAQSWKHKAPVLFGPCCHSTMLPGFRTIHTASVFEVKEEREVRQRGLTVAVIPFNQQHYILAGLLASIALLKGQFCHEHHYREGPRKTVPLSSPASYQNHNTTLQSCLVSYRYSGELNHGLERCHCQNSCHSQHDINCQKKHQH